MSQTIELVDIGPIKHVSIPVPEGGGLCVLRGRNGRGKSKALEAIDAALSGRGGLSVRDGALRGEVNAFGVKITVGRSTRRTGELEVESLEGRLDVAALVDPLVKSPEAADARRIKALVSLAGVTPSPELFHGLVGGAGEFEKLVSKTTAESDDLVVMAERVKRELEAAARKAEDAAEHAAGHAQAKREAAAGVDLSAESDAATLQQALEEAIRSESSLKAQAAAAEKAAKTIREAQERLEDAEAAYQGPTAAEALASERKAEELVAAVNREVQEVEALLAKNRALQQEANAALAAAIRERKAAEQHEQTIAAWRDQLAADLPAAVSADELAERRAAVSRSRAAVELGALIRDARRKLDESEQSAAKAKQHRAEAQRLREAAKATDEVLSGAIAACGSPLRVEAGRLVLDTRRGATYFGELSHGERWRLALDIAIEKLGPGGVLTIPQEAFESLDPQNRQAIAEHVAGRGVLVLTAEASADEELRAEVI